MELLIWLLAAYGMSQILVYGSIFDKQREWITDYFLQGAAYCMAHDTIYGTQIDKFVVMMCSADLYYQEFILQGKELKDYKYLWLERLDKYHRNSYIDGRKE